MVPMQKNDTLDKNLAYACFTIMFILTGLITLASSMNLLVLRLATINAEEQVQEKLVAAEALRNAVRVEGDVISPNMRQFATTQENQLASEQLSDTISVCSCACMDYKVFRDRGRTQRNSLPKSSVASSLFNKERFSVKRLYRRDRGKHGSSARSRRQQSETSREL